MKSLTFLKIVQKAASNFCSGFPTLSLVDFFQCTFFMAGFRKNFRNNFQDHRHLSKQLLESQAAIRKPEQVSWRVLLEWFSQLVSDFIEAAETLFWMFFLQKDRKRIVKTINAHTESTVLSLKNIHIMTLSLWQVENG